MISQKPPERIKDWVTWPHEQATPLPQPPPREDMHQVEKIAGHLAGYDIYRKGTPLSRVAAKGQEIAGDTTARNILPASPTPEEPPESDPKVQARRRASVARVYERLARQSDRLDADVAVGQYPATVNAQLAKMVSGSGAVLDKAEVASDSSETPNIFPLDRPRLSEREVAGLYGRSGASLLVLISARNNRLIGVFNTRPTSGRHHTDPQPEPRIELVQFRTGQGDPEPDFRNPIEVPTDAQFSLRALSGVDDGSSVSVSSELGAVVVNRGATESIQLWGRQPELAAANR